nr:proteasome subunit alpha type-4 [Tanacetum cinerariifolium]
MNVEVVVDKDDATLENVEKPPKMNILVSTLRPLSMQMAENTTTIKCCETLSEENRRLKKDLREARCSSKFDHHQQLKQLPPSFYIRYSSNTETRHQCDNIGKTGEDMKPVAAVNGSTVTKEDIVLEEAVQLALKVLSKMMDSTSLTSEKLELAEVFLSSSGKVKYQVCTPDALSKMLVKYGVTQPAAEA